jgi:sulfotransferase
MRLYFLAGLPRSGSTLLSALLSQRKDTYVSPTSDLYDVTRGAYNGWRTSPSNNKQYKNNARILDILASIIETHYADHSEPIIIDKGRSWTVPKAIESMTELLDEVKIIATVRPMTDCLASFVKIKKVRLERVENFCNTSQIAEHLFLSYKYLELGYNEFPDVFHFIEYDNLVEHTECELQKVEAFLNMKPFSYKLRDIRPGASKEDDSIWRIKGLHKVRSTIYKRKYDGYALLGDKIHKMYQWKEFWK